MLASDRDEGQTLPLLSIITPCFNSAQYIAACIENVLNQRCTEVEHIIVDGGSTDKTVEIIRKFASNVRWISEKDRGQSDAMNKGIALARGEYISFLNADDFYEPNTLSRIVELISSYPPLLRPRFFLGNCRILNGNDQEIGLNRPGPITHCDLLLGSGKTIFPINPAAYFYERRLHDSAGLYQVHEHQHMDLEFLLRVSRKTSLNYYDELWENFRLYEGTKSQIGSRGYNMVARWQEIIRPFQDALPWPQRICIKALNRFYRTRAYSLFKKAKTTGWLSARLRMLILGRDVTRQKSF